MENMEMGTDEIKVIVSRFGLDGHDLGAETVDSWLKQGSREMVHVGIHQTFEGTIKDTIDEDGDEIGSDILPGEHFGYTPRIVEEKKWLFAYQCTSHFQVSSDQFVPGDVKSMDPEDEEGPVSEAGSLSLHGFHLLQDYASPPGTSMNMKHSVVP
ncbi:MAG: hypothetical protein P8182_13340 [Deltaproteobacteria bacterium]